MVMEPTNFLVAHLLPATAVYAPPAPAHVELAGGGVLVIELSGVRPLAEKRDDRPTYDCHFVTVAVEPLLAEAPACRVAFGVWLSSYPQRERLADGPSYIEFAAAAEIEQLTTFRVFALGEHLGLWSIITPERLGYSGQKANALALSGSIYISGYRPTRPWRVV